jgi:hypothetical protein
MGEWRKIPKLPPIGKYPRNPRKLPPRSEDILLTALDCPFGHIYIGFFDRDGYLHGWNGQLRPTHWMPLPPPTAVDAAEGSKRADG